ncbi:MAG: hypothetical protein ACTS6J_24095 [Burkholderiales bacterium]
MEWFSENWIWVLIFGGFIAMHMFGHGGHGGYGGESGGGRNDDPKPASKDSVKRTSKQGSGHQH